MNIDLLIYGYYKMKNLCFKKKKYKMKNLTKLTLYHFN